MQIDEGCGDRYNLCQSCYLPKPLYTPEGISQYKLADGKAAERGAEEIEANRAKLPAPAPSDSERLDALESAMLAVMMGRMGNV